MLLARRQDLREGWRAVAALVPHSTKVVTSGNSRPNGSGILTGISSGHFNQLSLSALAGNASAHSPSRDESNA